MSAIELIVIAGFLGVLFGLDGIQKTLRKNNESDNSDAVEAIREELNWIRKSLERIEEHTGRVAEPLYDQDKFEREHLIGKYDPDNLR